MSKHQIEKRSIEITSKWYLRVDPQLDSKSNCKATLMSLQPTSKFSNHTRMFHSILRTVITSMLRGSSIADVAENVRWSWTSMISDSVKGVHKSYTCCEICWAMKFNDLLAGNGSPKEKLEIADRVTGVRKSYICYDIALNPKVASNMLFKCSWRSARRHHVYV